MNFFETLVCIGTVWILGVLLAIHNVKQARKERQERMRIYRIRKQKQNELLKKNLGLDND